MDFTFTQEMPTPEKIWALYQTTGWNEEYDLTPAEVHRALRSSWYLIAVYHDSQLVGFGRLVSDGVLHAMLYELIVAPAFQNRGVGSKILERLIARCETHRIRDIQLFCARGKRQFYEKRGFVARPEEAPGMQYKPY